MPNENGIWDQQEADSSHIFSYRVAQWIGKFLTSYKRFKLYDFGCGKGAYSRYFEDLGFLNVCGIDGIKYEGIENSNFFAFDLTVPAVFSNQGNVICLEVGEHIPEQYLQVFIDNITNACNGFIILSWAVPGQDGIGHVACRSNEWVKDELWKRGFKFLNEETQQIRKVPEGFVNYFKETLMIFEKIS